MKNILVLVFLIINTNSAYGADTTTTQNKICSEYSWDDVVYMMQDYLDDMLHAALVMQGQSSSYNVSEAAMQAMAEPKLLPEDVLRELQAIADAGCPDQKTDYN